jgi:hypothetical protein
MAAQASVSFFEMATLHRGISLAYDVPSNYTKNIDMALYVGLRSLPLLMRRDRNPPPPMSHDLHFFLCS